MTYLEFKHEFDTNILPNKPTFIRKGQAIINYLADVWFEEYKRISSEQYRDVDCFYNDKLITNTLNHLEKVWSQYPN